ncbi:MAG TPA: DUF1444 family protein [Phenylobacterium sp.]
MALFDLLTGGSAKDKFARRVMQHLRERGWSEPLEYDKSSSRIVHQYGSHDVSLPFEDSQNADEPRRREIIEQLADIAFRAKAGPPSLEEAAPSLLPVVRPLIHLQEIWFSGQSWEATPFGHAHKPIAGALSAVVAIDFGHGHKLVGDADLEKWGADFETALALSVENLRARTRQAPERGPGGYFVSSYEDFYDASRLLLTDLIETLPLKGDPVAIAPSRDALLVAGSEEPEALGAMAGVVEAALERPHRFLSPAPLVWRDGEWWLYDGRDVEDPLARLASRTKQLGWSLITRALEAQPISGFQDATRPMVVTDPVDGRINQRALISPAKTTLCPAVDVVVLQGPDGELIARSFSDLQAIWGPFQEIPDVAPPIYVVPQLSAESLAQMKARPVAEGYTKFEEDFLQSR